MKTLNKNNITKVFPLKYYSFELLNPFFANISVKEENCHRMSYDLRLAKFFNQICRQNLPQNTQIKTNKKYKNINYSNINITIYTITISKMKSIKHKFGFKEMKTKFQKYIGFSMNFLSSNCDNFTYFLKSYQKKG